MNKKMVFGILVTVVGLVFSAFCFIYTIMNPCIYNGISTVVMCIGLLLCFVEAYRKN